IPMSNATLKQALENLKLPNLQWAGFREVRETSVSRYVRDGKPQSNETQVSHGVMAEVLVDGQFAYASTSRLDPESLTAAARQAFDQARKASAHGVHRFTTAQRPPVKTHYASSVKQPLDKLSAREVSDLLVRISDRLKRSPKIIRTSAVADTVTTQMSY